MATPLINATKNIIFSFLNLLSSFIIGIVISIIVARGLGPDTLGRYSFITFLLSLLTTVFGLGLPATITKYVSEYLGSGKKKTLSKILGLSLKISFLSSLLAAVLFFLAFWFLDPIHNPIKTTGLAVVAALLVFPLLINNVLRGVFSGAQNFDYLFKVSISSSFLTLAGTILVLIFHWGIYGILILSLVINAMILFLYLAKSQKDFFSETAKEEISADYLSDFYRYAVSVAVISIIELIVWQYSEVIFLGIFRAPREVAYYTLPFNIALMAMTMLPGAILQTLMPVLSNLHGQADSEGMKKTYFVVTKFNYLIIVPLCFIFGILAKDIILTLYGPTYAESAKILPILIVSSGMAFLSTSGALFLYSIKKQNLILKYMIFTAVLNVTLDILLIPKFGIYGAVTGNVVAQVSASMFTIWYTLKELKSSVNVYALIKPIVAACVMGVVIYLASHFLNGIVGLVVAIALGVPTYFVCLPALKFFTPEDQSLFYRIGEIFPARLKKPYDAIIKRLILKA